MSDDHFQDRYLPRYTLLERDFVVRTVAVDKILGREVLITQLEGKVGRRAAVQDRFREAARSAVRLSHPNVVALYDIGTIGGMPYVIQEYSHSEPLEQIMEHEGPFHPYDVSVLVSQVADALDYANQRGLPHLALTPDVITVDYDGVVLVSDFGVGWVMAKISPAEPNAVRYRAPEIISVRNGDHRSDVYSLGIIGYEMLTGSSPFTAETVAEMREQVLSSSVPFPTSVNPEVPLAVSRLIMKAISRDPGDRFQSAGHFAEALADWQGSLPDAQTVAFLQDGSVFAPTEQLERAWVEPLRADNERPHQANERRLRRAAMVAWLSIVVALIALGWIAMNLLDVGWFDGDESVPGLALASPTPTIVVTPSAIVAPTAPSLVGLTIEEAQGSTDVAIRVVATETSDTVPAGQIIRQSPNPGRPVRTGDLAVVVSSGAGPQPINLSALPVEGQDFEAIAQELTALGLNVSQVSEGSTEVPEGNVIRIEESSAEPGDTVQVVTSVGDRVQIPFELQSAPVIDAVRTLAGLGFEPGEPIAVSRSRIESFNVDLDASAIADGDVVGIQEENAGFGQWVPRGATVTPVYYEASLDQ